MATKRVGKQPNQFRRMAVDRLSSCENIVALARNSLDNARCESFMRSLKREEIGARSFSTLEEVRRNIEQFIEQYYNVQRLRSAFGYRAPVEFEMAEGPAIDARGTSAVLVI